MAKNLEELEKPKSAVASINAAKTIENELCLFPLFTKKALTKRWGVSYSVVNNWEVRHADFPVRITGMVVGETEGGKGGGASNSLYPACEVFAYEKERHITILENSREELEPWGWNEDEQI